MKVRWRAIARVLLSLVLVLTAVAGSAADIRQEDLDANLINAAGEGRLPGFNLVLGLGANINAVDRRGNNAVLMATQGRQQGMLRMLLDKGVDANARGGSGFTPLTYAAMHGMERELQMLLKAGADPNRPSSHGDAPLHLAIAFRHLGIAKALLDAGARIEGTNGMGETSLMVAVRLDIREAFDSLLAWGARPSVVDNSGRSALFLAIWESREAMALELIAKGAGYYTVFNGFTPLRMAQLMQQTNIVEALEKRGASQ